jgi:(1->4)-alpha-D-glucan 1-alpha-D-glucosylmutase
VVGVLDLGERVMPAAIPLATYRVQLNKDFGFEAAAKFVPYLKDLGITHLYASPFLKARAGSMHGYDIVDHGSLNPEFGGESGFAALSDALKQADMGLILDFVPNHMGIGHADNAWWLDVLEWGQQSPHAAAFDISWELLPYRRDGGVLVPVLGKPYGEVLDNGKLVLKYDSKDGTFSVWYFDHKFPINPHRYGEIIRVAINNAEAAETPAGRALLDLAGRHPHPQSPSYSEAPEYKRQLAAIQGADEVMERGLAAYRSDHDAGRHALHRLLERQHYRIAYWRVAVSSVNYRRFFDINDLAGVRVENRPTFRAMHGLIGQLIAADRLQGLRLDHIDGLRDPQQYTRRLRHFIRQSQGAGRRPFHVTVEKILAEGETLPQFTGVSGTTGYEWLNLITGVLADSGGLPRLESSWREATGERASFEEILEEAKLRVLDTMLASEFTVLTELLARIAAGHYSTRDYTLDRLRAALQAYVIEFPIYRTYATTASASENDRAVIDKTIAAARKHWAGPDPQIFDFLRDVVTLDLIHDPRTYSRPRIQNFALKLQQFTGPLMAKSLEDTAFYRHHRLLAFNEVGGHPTNDGVTIDQFHARLAKRAADTPHGLTATATHDTKRGEDARMRVLAISELAGDWHDSVRQWRRLNERLRTNAGPSGGHEYMLYQALIGAWPLNGIDESFVERMQAYAVKAAREGKLETSWINNNTEYEDALLHFVKGILDPTQSQEFIRSFEAMARRTALIGALNSLSQLVLKATMPGIPDFYQGTELWDLSLVDPDNRRPVDFDVRQQALAQQSDLAELAEHWTDGRIKLELTRRLLALRREMPAIFQIGTHEPLEVSGTDRDHVIAFARVHKRQRIIVAVGRHFAGLTDGGRKWPAANLQAKIDLDVGRGSRLHDAIGSLRKSDVLSGETSTLFRTLPVAVLRSG